MSGIAGVARAGQQALVGQMLSKMKHRGRAGLDVVDPPGATLGAVWPKSQENIGDTLRTKSVAIDDHGPGHAASATATQDGVVLRRDSVGVVPLYHGRTADGALCFASEVKALLGIAREIDELTPGTTFDGSTTKSYSRLEALPSSKEPVEELTKGLRDRLARAVEERIGAGPVGSWLSGGLDSSTMAALARPHVEELHTFAAGFPGAPDLKFATQAAEFIQATHHEVIVSVEDLLQVLPQVIYHLESFDALLVRSSLTNYLVGQAASEYVPAVFSGEGGDELFAGYEYLRSLPPSQLPAELLDIIGRLHNTALQRVDRCSSAHGVTAYVPFVDPTVLDYALRIPAEFKLRDGVEKWILRRALDGALPQPVLERTKAKFWEGAGVGDHLAAHAEEQITDADFAKERKLPNGATLNSKEELLYYRVFREHFGDLDQLDWMGRTKGAPVTGEPGRG